MKIHRLTLENFRCFSQKTLEFTPEFNVLAGDNGTGKSAILDAVATGIGAFLLGIDAADSRAIRKDDVRRVSSLNANVPTIEMQYPVRIRAEGTVNDEALSWYRSLYGEGKRTTIKGAQNIREIARELQAEVRAGSPVTLPLIAYYGTGRMWHRKPQYVNMQMDILSMDFEAHEIKDPASNGNKTGSKPTRQIETVPPGSRLDGYDECLDAETNQSFLDRWFKTYEMSVLQRNKPNPVLQGIKDAVVRSMDRGQKITYDIQLDVLMAEDAAGNRMPARLLSDGQRNILYMVLDIAYRAATLNPHFEDQACQNTPGIVLIDEIDLHLHPRWQRRVVDDLRSVFPGIQFIATTHSPNIIQSLRAGELIDLNDGDPGEYVGRSPEDILEQVMDVELPQRSLRSQRMIAAATEYYKVLQEAQSVSNGQLEAMKQQLDELMAPFADNEAYIAFLQQERIAAGLGKK